MIDPITQPIFCATLNYFQRGRYSAFKRACEITWGVALAEDPFSIANLYSCAHIAGLIDVGEQNNLSFWMASFQANKQVRPSKKKEIGTDALWFSEHPNAEPIILDAQNRPLLYGQRSNDLSNGSDFFESTPYSRVSPLKRIEKYLCTPEVFRTDFSGHYELFNHESGRWVSGEINRTDGLTLIRVRKQFSGNIYYIVDVRLHILIRVLLSDWAFPLWLFLSGSSLVSTFKYSSGTLQIPRVIKMPALIYRRLFASCSIVKIGAFIEFTNLDRSTYQWLQDYLFPSGVGYAS